MATTKKTTEVATDYKSRITKSPDVIASEQVDLRVQKADNLFQQGLLSLKSKMIDEQANVKTAENKLAEAKAAIETAKSAQPEYLVQALINAKSSMIQAEIDLTKAQNSYKDLQSMYTFIEETGKELF